MVVSGVIWVAATHLAVVKWYLHIRRRHIAVTPALATITVCEVFQLLLFWFGLPGFWFCCFSGTAWFIALHLITNEFTSLGVPHSMRAPQLVSQTENSCVLQWRPPRDGGSDITGYNVELRRKNGLGWCQVTSGEIRQHEYLVPNLVRGQQYMFRVMARNAFGQGFVGKETDLVHLIGLPSPPRELEVSDVTGSSCLVSWLPPEDDGGGPIKTYHVEMCLIQDDFAGEWEFGGLAEGDSHVLRISSLSSGLAYLFRIMAVNQAGSSSPAMTHEPVLALGDDMYDGTLAFHSLQDVNNIGQNKASSLFVRGVYELNKFVVMLVSLQPRTSSREYLLTVSKDFKAVTSRALFFFQDSVQVMKITEDDVDQRLTSLLVNQMDMEQNLERKRTTLRCLEIQLREQMNELRDAKDRHIKIHQDYEKANKVLDETVKQLEAKRREQVATNTVGGIAIGGGIIVSGIATVMTVGAAAPLLVAAVSTTAAGTATVVAGCTVLEKNKQAAENAVQLAGEEATSRRKAEEWQEKEIKLIDQKVREEETHINQTEQQLVELLDSIHQLQIGQREHHCVSGRLKDCIGHLALTAGKAEVLDDVTKYMQTFDTVLPILADLARHFEKTSVLELEMFSRLDTQLLGSNLQALTACEDEPDSTEMVPAQSTMMMQQELLGAQVVQWAGFIVRLPELVLGLGTALLTCNARDFPVDVVWRNKTLPKSFRACLYQVGSDASKTLRTLQTNMDKVKLQSKEISRHTLRAANIVTNGENEEVVQLLPVTLSLIQELAEKASANARENEVVLDEWLSMASALIEACLVRQSLNERERQDVREKYGVVLAELEAAKKEKHMLAEELKDLQMSLDTASLETSRSLTGLSSGYSLAVIFNMNILSNASRLRFGMFNDSSEKLWTKFKNRVKKCARSNKDTAANVPEDGTQLLDLIKEAELAKSALVDMIHKITPPDHSTFIPDNIRRCKVQMEVYLKKVKRMQGSRYQQILQKILEATSSVCETLLEESTCFAGTDDYFLMSMPPVLFKHHKTISDFIDTTTDHASTLAFTKAATQRPVEKPKDETVDNERVVIVNVAQHQVNQQVMKMTETYFQLQEAKKAFDQKSWDMQKMNSRLLSDVEELAEVEGSCTSLDETLLSVLEAVKCLNRVKQQWAGFSQMFGFVSNRLEHSLVAGVQHFAEITETEMNRVGQGSPASQYARKLLWQEVRETCALAECLHQAAGEYVTASSEYLMPPINHLGELLQPSGRQSNQQRLTQLQTQCVVSQRRIQEQIEASRQERLQQYERAINDVIESMKQLAPPGAEKRFPRLCSPDLQDFA